MTEITDEIMAKAREVVAKFPTPPDNRNECVKTIAAALLSERTASEAALKEARAKLFPYADATEISGMSWNGFYLIGDEKSINELRRLENRSSQIEIFKAAFDEKVATLEAENARLRARVAVLEKALQPFAAYLDTAAWDLNNNGDPLPDDHGMGWVYLTIGNFREARAALTPAKENDHAE